MSEHKLTCINCPLGCALNVSTLEGKVVSVEGMRCKRGESYAKQEALDPRRVFSTTVTVEGGHLPCVPVKLSAPVKKAHILEIARKVQSLRLKAPIHFGQVIMDNVDGEEGVQWLSCREIKAV